MQDVVNGVLDDQSQVQIAEDLQVNQVTVRTRLRRARSILQRELAAYVPCCRPRAAPKADGRDGPAGQVGPP
ncbi:MAG: hypothetical protein ACREX3_00840 [Gammaproteobacteria bacterium]